MAHRRSTIPAAAPAHIAVITRTGLRIHCASLYDDDKQAITVSGRWGWDGERQHALEQALGKTAGAGNRLIGRREQNNAGHRRSPGRLPIRTTGMNGAI